MESCHFQWKNPHILEMVSFHRYVELPEGNYRKTLLNEGL